MSRAKPDPTLTPGEVGLSPMVRNVTAAAKRQVYRSYGISLLRRLLYVIDHLIPLELNGTNGISNLWPQPRLQARLKDRDENRLARAVVDGRMRLVDAQREILREWA